MEYEVNDCNLLQFPLFFFQNKILMPVQASLMIPKSAPKNVLSLSLNVYLNTN